MTLDWPLARGQEALWFLQRMDPSSSAYAVPMAALAHGEVSADQLAWAFRQMAERHPLLRASVVSSPEGPRLRVSASSGAVTLVDAAGWRNGDLKEAIGRASLEPFDVDGGPLYRAHVFSRGKESPAFLFNAHHLVMDLWSAMILLEDLGALCGQALGGQSAPRAKAAAHDEYVRCQEEWLAGSAGESARRYWTQALARLPPAVELPADRSRIGARRRGSRFYVELASATVDAVRALTSAEGVTAFTVFLAAQQILQSRYTGQLDVVTGAPAAGRRRLDHVFAVGYFVNPIALRSDLTGNPSARSLLRQVKEVTERALVHQLYPFPLVAQVARRGEEPLFRTFVSVQRPQKRAPRGAARFALGVPGARVTTGPLALEALPLPAPSPQFDLQLYWVEEDGFWGSCHYDAGIFDERTARRMAGHVEAIIRAMARDPDARIDHLSLCDGAEPRSAPPSLVGARLDLPLPGAHILIEEQARRRPETIAVVGRDRAMSYAELEARASWLARHLASAGAGPGCPVALFLEQGAEEVVAMLAALKAGAAYVPLSPSAPAARNQDVLSDSAAGVLITQRALAAELAAGPSVRRLVVEELDEKAPAAALPATGPDTVAYILYTSGSTGRPKGVRMPQRALVNLLRSMQRRPGLGGADVLLSVTTLSFDISALERLLPLTVGGRVVVATRDQAGDGEALGRLLTQSGATVMQATPSTWRLLLESGWRGGAVKALCGGEALPPDLASALLERVSELWNMYGPTETTIWSSCNRVASGEPISIGGPVDHTWLYVVGAAGDLEPEGVVGELCIGGEGLAHGYHGRPGLTAERFVPDPFRGLPGARMYRTGDLVRQGPEGRLAFVGRIDHQVKIRGHRVELSEIEVVLRRQDGVGDAVVTLAGAAERAQLCAYVTAEAPGTLDVDRVRRGLSTLLPPYMVPAAYVVLDSLPRTQSGKIDRKALPAPAEPPPPPGRVAPRTATEAQVAAVWADVLGQPGADVDVEQDFFAAGGHSLLAARLIGKLAAAFSMTLPVRDLFDGPTIERLARRIESRRRTPADEPDDADGPRVLEDAGRSLGPRELSSSERRLWFLCQIEPDSPVYHLAGGVRVDGPLDLAALDDSLRAIQSRHGALRTRFVTADGVPVAVVGPDPDAALPLERLTALGDTPEARDQDARRRFTEIARAPMDLERGPLFRAAVASLAPERHLLLVVAHHLIADGQSLEQIGRELGTAYQAHRAGREPAFPAVACSYASYVAYEQALRRARSFDAGLVAHRERLHGAPQVLALPCDAPRPPVHRSVGHTEVFELTADLTAALAQIAHASPATLFMALTAAFGAFLGRLSGQDDLLLATPHAGRVHPDLEGMVGLLVNTLVLRVRLHRDPSFAALLRAVRHDALAAYAGADTPYDLLVEHLVGARDPSRPPLCQASIAAQGDPLAGLALAGLALAPWRVETGSAKFDVSLYYTEAGDRLACALEFNAAVFSRDTGRRWVRQFQTFLTSLAHAPDRPLSRCDWMDAAERRRLLSAMTAPPADLSPAGGLHRLVEDQTRRTPSGRALVAGRATLSYAQLDQRANRLAWELVRRGVKPEDRVGVCAERSAEMVIALLGILKAGAAYVPLDPTYPRQRLRMMCEDAQLSLAVAPSPLGASVPDGILVLEVDALAPVEAADAPPIAVANDQAAYVLFTSGSTGRPKGAIISHAGIQNRLLWMQSAYGLQAGEAVLQKTPFGFDVSVWELFWPLMVGATLVMARPEGHKDPRYLAETIAQHEVTTVHFVPSMLRAFLDEPLAAGCRSLRQIVCSGEALPPELVRRCASALPWVALHNLYGPTEASVDVSFWRCRPDEARASTPIGRPVANTRLCVLDRHLEPVPIGIPGELYIGGVQLARGYVGRPGLTAAAFVPDPLSVTGGERLYRTGDLARWREDGELEFCGRIDHQVKLRGFRIETEEIESHVLANPEVKEAVVVLRGGEHPRLIAYVVPRHGAALDVTGLRARLVQHLPEYMIPSVFVSLGELPLTSSGKLDRGALPEPPEPAEPASEPPETPLEREIAALWATLLGVPLERIGRHDDFFALGGHSILAAKVIARMRQAFAVDLPLSDLFRHTTVAAAADLILERQLAGVDADILLELLDGIEGQGQGQE